MLINIHVNLNCHALVGASFDAPETLTEQQKTRIAGRLIKIHQYDGLIQFLGSSTDDEFTHAAIALSHASHQPGRWPNLCEGGSHWTKTSKLRHKRHADEPNAPSRYETLDALIGLRQLRAQTMPPKVPDPRRPLPRRQERTT